MCLLARFQCVKLFRLYEFTRLGTCDTLRSPQRGVRSTLLFHLILWNLFLYVELHYQMLGFASVLVIHATIWHSAQHSEHPTRQASLLNTEPRIWDTQLSILSAQPSIRLGTQAGILKP